MPKFAGRHIRHFVYDRLRNGQVDPAFQSHPEQLKWLAALVDQPGNEDIRVRRYSEHSAPARFVFAAHFVYEPWHVLFLYANRPRVFPGLFGETLQPAGPRISPHRLFQDLRWLAALLARKLLQLVQQFV